MQRQQPLLRGVLEGLAASSSSRVLLLLLRLLLCLLIALSPSLRLEFPFANLKMQQLGCLLTSALISLLLY